MFDVECSTYKSLGVHVEPAKFGQHTRGLKFEPLAGVSAGVSAPMVIATPVPQTVSRENPSMAEELERLTDLHRKGHLDAEEFKLAKKRLLS